ncbi:cytochrome c oxidase subunit II [Rhizobium laguerreae]|uniref:cytochrome c oxidase subunit II n=1 Tax=Rhizobium laguerreae TaxID=1076926 RepID=UPI0028C39AC2|nr:cytochrome c oxidase subunit II [Rhizobium laguerreae]
MGELEHWRKGRPTILRCLISFSALVLAGCSGQQSALSPAGEESEAVYRLFVVMVIGGISIWLGVTSLLLHAGRHRREAWPAEKAGALIAWGGVAFPIVVLLLLLGYAVWLMPAIRPWNPLAAKEGAIEVTGEQFWWRIRYPAVGDHPAFETANEIRLPVGRPATFSLKATDVVHSFWIPVLGGKMDMIPGRTNYLTLTPTRTGSYRAPCAEFCGASHAYMAFSVIVMEEDDYNAWRRRLINGQTSAANEGGQLLQRHGCVGCHSLRGLQIAGQTAPDLTLIGARLSIGAGALANTPENIARFIRSPSSVKPGAKMPAFNMLPEDDIEEIARYLGGLK